MRRWVPLLLVFSVAGCRNAASPPPTATLPPLSPPETTAAQPTTTAPSFAVPAVIDLPYLQRVLETIYHLDGEAARHVYAKKLPDAEFYARLEAIYGGPRLTESKRVLGENAAEGFVLFADPPGDPTVRAIEIVQAVAGCMVIRADLDYGPLYREVRPRGPQSIIQLRHAEVLPFNPDRLGGCLRGST